MKNKVILWRIIAGIPLMIMENMIVMILIFGLEYFPIWLTKLFVLALENLCPSIEWYEGGAWKAQWEFVDFKS